VARKTSEPLVSTDILKISRKMILDTACWARSGGDGLKFHSIFVRAFIAGCKETTAKRIDEERAALGKCFMFGPEVSGAERGAAGVWASAG